MITLTAFSPCLTLPSPVYLIHIALLYPFTFQYRLGSWFCTCLIFSSVGWLPATLPLDNSNVNHLTSRILCHCPLNPSLLRGNQFGCVSADLLMAWTRGNVLIFSANKSGEFYGYTQLALILISPCHWYPKSSLIGRKQQTWVCSLWGG